MSIKPRLLTGVAIGAAALLALTACSGSPDSTDGSAPPADKTVKIAAPMSGPLGDKSFMDSAMEGFDRAMADFNVEVQFIQAGSSDAPAWERNLTEASASGENALIVTGTTQISSTLEKVAAQFPDQQYLLLDSGSVAPNVSGVSFAQNESAFLAGVLAALVTTNPQDFPKATGSKKVGITAGMDIPVIQDYILGFTQGVKAVDPSIQIDVRFTDDFGNAQKGYDIASAQFADGADVIYQVAGGSGLGVLQAGVDAGRYAIGNDSDQNAVHPEIVLASALKNVGNAAYAGIASFLKGELKPGSSVVVDLSDDGVGLTLNDALVPASYSSKIDDFRQQVVDGAIVVDSAF